MTTPEDGGVPETRVADFAAFVRPKEGEDPPIIVGGHAVNLWSEYFLARDVKELLGYLPFTSKDLDLVGSLGLLDRLHETHKGTLSRSEPRSPVLGRIDVEREGGGLLRVEVLHAVKGLDAKDLERTMEVAVGQVVARVLMPHLVLKAKIENSESIPQEGRNDVKHVHMMILCVRAFIREFAGYVGEGRASDRALINVLEETLAISTSGQAIKASDVWGFDFMALWPVDGLKSLGEGKVSRWLQHRFPENPT
jgi:hypothetical protein